MMNVLLWPHVIHFVNPVTLLATERHGHIGAAMIGIGTGYYVFLALVAFAGMIKLNKAKS